MICKSVHHWRNFCPKVRSHQLCIGLTTRAAVLSMLNFTFEPHFTLCCWRWGQRSDEEFLAGYWIRPSLMAREILIAIIWHQWRVGGVICVHSCHRLFQSPQGFKVQRKLAFLTHLVKLRRELCGNLQQKFKYRKSLVKWQNDDETWVSWY